jgi:3-isopropylmalate/(R)-2-methylmalate dehydratase large subunit
MAATSAPQTLYEKIWNSHVVVTPDDGVSIVYIDRHYIYEVCCPQAFDGLREKDIGVRRPSATLATIDHNVSTETRDISRIEGLSRKQIDTLIANCKGNDVDLFGLDHENNGITHVIFPELGCTHPGMVVSCGDSHTSTHGAFGALAFGTGTSDTEHVLATQTLKKKRSKTLQLVVNGVLPQGTTAKDLALYILRKVPPAEVEGHVIEYAGPVIEKLSMEGRMTLCNMSTELNCDAAMVPPDEITFTYLNGRPYAPSGPYSAAALAYWRSLKPDPDAHYDKVITIEASTLTPMVTWGTTLRHTISIDEPVPSEANWTTELEKADCRSALRYMDISPGTYLGTIPISNVFIGSCTNGRLEDLRAAAAVLSGHKVCDGVKAIVVPGSMRVRRQAEMEGLDRIFSAAGFEWRYSGCSMCIAMNDDKVEQGKYCASTSNRNFEGRQGKGARTFLVSPAMAAMAAISGTLVDVRTTKLG